MVQLADNIILACEDCSCSVDMRCWQFDNNDTFRTYMSKRVKDRLSDVSGSKELATYYDSIISTGFSDDILKNIFTRDQNIEPWRIGEALAECFLEDMEDISFPWNGIRDQKVEDESPPGADLVGFKGSGPEVRFLFGEVKTSSDKNHPPNVMYGRSGMTQQLERLKTNGNRRRKLVIWFAWRAKGENWEPDYKIALKAYCTSDEYVLLQGILVRDTTPDINDLKTRGLSLKRGKPSRMNIRLYGIFCPSDIRDFSTLIGGTVQL